MTEQLPPTLAQALKEDWVATDELYDGYRPVLEMVRELIGVIPNCNPVLEIWPPGFRTFNLLVPNLLNLPAALFNRGAPKDLVGIAMYSASRTAGCPYCTAHHCSFAIRRGADPDAVLGDRSPVEAAVADLAEAMATVPSAVTLAHVRAVEQHLPRQHVDWIVLAVALGGFLNKVMDTLGIQLEASAISDVQALLRPTGWTPGKHYWDETWDFEDRESSDGDGNGTEPVWAEQDTSDTIPVDGAGTYLRVIRRAPGAVSLERAWTKGISGRIGRALLLLEADVGYAFPVLAGINSAKVVKAFTTAIRDNLDPDKSAGGLRQKLMAGLVYASHVEDEMLTAEQLILIEHLTPGIPATTLSDLQRLGRADSQASDIPIGLSSPEASAVLLAKAASPSPSAVSELTVSAATQSLSSAEIVEVVIWLSLLQCLHRIYTVFDARLLDDDLLPGLRPEAGARSGL